MEKICSITGQKFDVPPEEMALRKKLGIDGEPTVHPVVRLIHLAAFWEHWNLHKRKCDYTGQEIISVYSSDCPYPVWQKDEWIKHAKPPEGKWFAEEDIFPQMWKLFKQCPIAHNIGTGNQNCEYTDDCWFSKNCYLFHSSLRNEDCRYCYRDIQLKDSIYATYSFESERTRDLIYSKNCFSVRYAINCRDCTDSAFLYDCRGCSNCFLCCNLRNQQYCIRNKYYSKEEYEQEFKKWNFSSNKTYQRAEKEFQSMMMQDAWHRALFIDNSENCTGNYIENSKNLTNCYFLDDAEDSVNVMRTSGSKDCLDCLTPAVKSELIYCSCTCQDSCYSCKYCFDLSQCKFMEYCAHCFQCQHCFACAGLVKKSYCIFNKQYSPEEYEQEMVRIINYMKHTGEYGKFFPGYFAATSYEESLAGYHWPLYDAMLEKFGLRRSKTKKERPAKALDASSVPDMPNEATADLPKQIFWDDRMQKPFRIEQADIDFSISLDVPLPSMYYMQRLMENFAQIPFNGELRMTVCGHCGKSIQTSWPIRFDTRILCEECYLKEVY